MHLPREVCQGGRRSRLVVVLKAHVKHPGEIALGWVDELCDSKER
jgi:hypothetical protein